MPSGVSWVLFLSGPIVAFAYSVSALFRSFAVDGVSIGPVRPNERGGGHGNDDRGNGDLGDPITTAAHLEVAAVLIPAALAWLVIRWQAPGQTTFQNASAVGFLSSQVLTAWSSLALWAGLAAVVGHAFPAGMRFKRGTSGIAGVGALLTAFLPITMAAACGAWFATWHVTAKVRPALALTFGCTAAIEWLLAVLALRGPWGLAHGPETMLFVLAAAGVLLGRWSVGDVGRSVAEAFDR